MSKKSWLHEYVLGRESRQLNAKNLPPIRNHANFLRRDVLDLSMENTELTDQQQVIVFSYFCQGENGGQAE